MKAFEEWWCRGQQYKIYNPFDTEDAAEDAWRAALEWIRVKLENYTPEDICYFIDEEFTNDSPDDS